MRKLSSLMVVSISMTVIMALVLGGCAGGGGTTSSTAASTPPSASNVAPPSPSSNASPPMTSTETIKVGVISSMSGFFSTLSQYMLPGAQMAVDKENASGGILGRKVELVTRDDTGDPSVVGQKADELKSAGCVGIVGAFLDSVDTALVQWGNANHVIISGTTDTTQANRTTKFGKYSFFSNIIDLAMANVFFQSISKQDDVKSIYFLSGDVIVTHDIHDTFWSLMNKAKPSVVNAGTNFIGMTETDLSGSINTLIAKKPDLVISGLGGPQWAAFVQQGTQFNLFSKVKVAAIYGLDASTSTPLGKNTPEGIQGLMFCPYFLDTPEMKAFQADFARRVPGQYVNDLTLNFYNATYALLEGIKKANSLDTDKIIAAMENLSLDTPLGTVSMDAYDHQLEVPIWWITTKNLPDYPIVGGTNLVKYQQGIYPTQDQIMSLRNAK